jgi:hypothetical protein
MLSTDFDYSDFCQSFNPAGQWMHCVKLLGQRLSARDFDRQVAEIQIQAAILNGFNALGIPNTVAVG